MKDKRLQQLKVLSELTLERALAQLRDLRNQEIEAARSAQELAQEQVQIDALSLGIPGAIARYETWRVLKLTELRRREAALRVERARATRDAARALGRRTVIADWPESGPRR